MAITTQRTSSLESDEILLEDWQHAGLLKPSLIKAIITTIEPTLVLKKLGRLSQKDHAALKQVLATILG